jgi:hypothetical protein
VQIDYGSVRNQTQGFLSFNTAQEILNITVKLSLSDNNFCKLRCYHLTPYETKQVSLEINFDLLAP